jgi:anti-sigma factor ChrR (cupin superfamily)
MGVWEACWRWIERVDVAREGARGVDKMRALVWLDHEPNLPTSGVGCKLGVWPWREPGRDWTGVENGEADDKRARLRWYEEGACDEPESF